MVKTTENYFHRGGIWRVVWIDLKGLYAGIERPEGSNVVICPLIELERM